jgi:hypothetical protein
MPYTAQSMAYAEAEPKRVSQKAFNESMLSKAVAIGENHEMTNGQDYGQAKSGSNSKSMCGCSLAWFRTSACHVDDPGSNPGNRTIIRV